MCVRLLSGGRALALVGLPGGGLAEFVAVGGDFAAGTEEGVRHALAAAGVVAEAHLGLRARVGLNRSRGWGGGVSGVGVRRAGGSGGVRRAGGSAALAALAALAAALLCLNSSSWVLKKMMRCSSTASFTFLATFR